MSSFFRLPADERKLGHMLIGIFKEETQNIGGSNNRCRSEVTKCVYETACRRRCRPTSQSNDHRLVKADGVYTLYLMTVPCIVQILKVADRWTDRQIDKQTLASDHPIEEGA